MYISLKLIVMELKWIFYFYPELESDLFKIFDIRISLKCGIFFQNIKNSHFEDLLTLFEIK